MAGTPHNLFCATEVIHSALINSPLFGNMVNRGGAEQKCDTTCVRILIYPRQNYNSGN